MSKIISLTEQMQYQLNIHTQRNDFPTKYDVAVDLFNRNEKLRKGGNFLVNNTFKLLPADYKNKIDVNQIKMYLDDLVSEEILEKIDDMTYTFGV